MTSNEQIVIVGAGRAGVAAAEELRLQGFDGELVILHDEDNMPYDRPACAKGLLTGHDRPKDVHMPVLDGTEAHWMLGRRAVYLDTEAQTVVTDTDEAFEYDGLVIATGAGPVIPPSIPVGEPGIHALYGLNDAWSLRADLRTARRVAVIGAGMTGCEVASAVKYLSRECILINPRDYVLTGPLGEYVGQMMTNEMERQGVKMRMGRRVSEMYRSRRGWVLVLDDGEEVEADVVVATTGERPDTQWLQAAEGVDASDGVLCDETLRVVGVDNVVAAGTVARWPNLQYSADPQRIGQWICALEHGRSAAQALMAGPDAPLPPVTHMPRFWSDQFGVRIQVCGQLPADAEVTITEMRPGRSDVARAGVIVGYYQDDALVGLVAVNAVRQFTAMARAMLSAQGPVVEPQPLMVPMMMEDERPLLSMVS